MCAPPPLSSTSVCLCLCVSVSYVCMAVCVPLLLSLCLYVSLYLSVYLYLYVSVCVRLLMCVCLCMCVCQCVLQCVRPSLSSTKAGGQDDTSGAGFHVSLTTSFIYVLLLSYVSYYFFHIYKSYYFLFTKLPKLLKSFCVRRPSLTVIDIVVLHLYTEVHISTFVSFSKGGREYDLTWLGAELIAQLASAVVDWRLLAAPAIRQLGWVAQAKSQTQRLYHITQHKQEHKHKHKYKHKYEP